MRISTALFASCTLAAIAGFAALTADTGVAQEAQPRTSQPDFTNARMLRYPDVSATHICFVYGGDIWTAPKDGGNATRLSSAPGEEYKPRFSPDGKLLASASMEGTAKIWDFATGNLIATLTGHVGYVWAAVFSPDGKLLATCGHDQTIKLWDTATWREVATLIGHTNEVFSVAFTPDGSRLASASNDKTVKLWDVARRQEVLTLKDHTDQVWSVAFTPATR